MVVRGVIVTYETIRQWCAKFGPVYAAGLRRRQPRPGDKWHLDEVFLTINGRRQYLWRAVDQDGNILDILVSVQARRQGRQAVLRQTPQQAVRVSSGAGHRPAPKLSSGASGGDGVGRAPAVEVPQQPGGELAPADPAPRTRHETLPHPRRSPTVPGGVQRDLPAFPAPPSAHRSRLSHRNDPTIRRLERGHRTDCRSLTHTTDTQPTQPLHAPIPLSPSQVDSAPRTLLVDGPTQAIPPDRYVESCVCFESATALAEPSSRPARRCA